MKKISKIKGRKEDDIIISLFNDHFLKRIEDEKREKRVLIDKFDLHIKGKEIILENTK